MDIVKALLDLISGWLNRSTQKSKEEIVLADKTEKAVVEEIRANTNATIVQQRQELDDELENINNKHKQDRKDAKKDPNIDDTMFGSDW